MSTWVVGDIHGCADELRELLDELALAPGDALQFLLKGDQLRLNRAKAMKLVDAVVPPADLVKAGKDWAKANAKASCESNFGYCRIAMTFCADGSNRAGESD